MNALEKEILNLRRSISFIIEHVDHIYSKDVLPSIATLKAVEEHIEKHKNLKAEELDTIKAAVQHKTRFYANEYIDQRSFLLKKHHLDDGFLNSFLKDLDSDS